MGNSETATGATYRRGGVAATVGLSGGSGGRRAAQLLQLSREHVQVLTTDTRQVVNGRQRVQSRGRGEQGSEF